MCTQNGRLQGRVDDLNDRFRHRKLTGCASVQRLFAGTLLALSTAGTKTSCHVALDL